MKKVLIASSLERLCRGERSFLDRTGIRILTAATTDEILRVHKLEKADLIATTLDLPGTGIEEIFDIIRKDRELKNVSTIIVCEDTVIHQSRGVRCGANTVLSFPIDTAKLHAGMQRLLNVAPRQAYRVALNVAVEGHFKSKPFLCRTENISASGMLIRAEQIFSQDDRIAFSFYLPDGTRVSAQGTILRVIKAGTASSSDVLYGIQFATLAPADKSAIEAFVRKETDFKRSLDSSSKTSVNKSSNTP